MTADASASLADEAESGVDGFFANRMQCVIRWRAIPSQSRVPIGEGDDHAGIVGRLAVEHMPWTRRQELAAELLQYRANCFCFRTAEVWSKKAEVYALHRFGRGFDPKTAFFYP